MPVSFFWHHTEQVYSFMFWGHLFFHFSFNKFFWAFVTRQAFSRNGAMGGQQDRQNPCSRNLHLRIFKYLNIITWSPSIFSAAGYRSNSFLNGVWAFWFITLFFQIEETEVPCTAQPGLSVSCARCRGSLRTVGVDTALLMQPKVDGHYGIILVVPVT